MKRLVRGLVALGFVGLTLASSTRARAEEKVEFWHSMSGEGGKILDDIVGKFNAANKGKITVKAQYTGSYDEGINKLRTAMMGGQLPNVVQVYDIGTRAMIDSKQIVPLGDLAAKDKDFPNDKMLRPIKRYYEIGGKLYSLPFSTSNPILYYNKDMFAKAGLKDPPKTVDQLREFAAKLTDAKARLTGITWPLHSWFFEQYVAKQGALLILPDNGRGAARADRSNISGDEAVRFVSLWKELVEKGHFANVGRGWEPAEQNFLAMRSAMFITSTSNVFLVDKMAKFKVGTAPIPAFSEEKKPGGTIIGGNSLWLMAGKPAAQEQAAYEFLKFMASKNVQKEWHARMGYFPIRQDAIDELEKEGFYKKFPNARTAIDQLLASADVVATQGALMGVFTEARGYIESAIEETLSSKVSVKDALKKAEDKTNQALQRYNRSVK